MWTIDELIELHMDHRDPLVDTPSEPYPERIEGPMVEMVLKRLMVSRLVAWSVETYVEALAQGPADFELADLRGALDTWRDQCEKERSMVQAAWSWRLVFADHPEQWGFRADPYVWNAMLAQLAAGPAPTSPQMATTLLRGAFATVVGYDLDDPGASPNIYKEELDFGGMSGGQVSMEYWREQFMPLLKRRASALLAERAPKGD